METLESYLEALASAQPTPGGGSAAAVAAALGAALIAMAARITLGNPKYAEKHEAARAIVEEADALRALLLAGREIDEAAYGEVVKATALPRESREQKTLRDAALQEALNLAAEAPLEAASLSVRTLEVSERCLSLDNAHLASDVGCAAEFAAAALAAAAYNVRVNHRFLKDAELVERQEALLRTYEIQTQQALQRVRRSLFSTH